MTQKHLFLFTLGPVQSFIAQARKTQDLYAGSKLLSELIKEAIKMVGQDNVIFPYVKGKDLQTEIDSLPNRFIAEINKAESKLAELGQNVEKEVKDKFKKIAEDIFTKSLNLDKNNTNKKLWEKFEKQISQHLDIHWLFLPFTDATYAEKFTEIEQLLGAIKNVRTFEQNEETGRKCSIDGERNALFFGKGSNKVFWESEKWNKNSYAIELHQISNVIVARGEGLSGVSILKRFYNEEGEKFPSTAGIALMDHKDKIVEYKNCFDTSTFDEQLVFDENLTDDYIQKYGIRFQVGFDLNQVRNKRQELFSKVKLSKYYALIAFDADSMGEWLSGNKINNNQGLRAFHEALSKKLLEFGSWATRFLNGNLNKDDLSNLIQEKIDFYKKAKGKAVYAGGDDFLGFVNLKHLFSVMRELRSKFDTIVNCGEITQLINGSDRLSFSAGIVVAHYKTPLRNVLEKARELEKNAKARFEKSRKDAIGFAFMTRSSLLGQSYFKSQDIAVFESLIESYHDKNLSNSFIDVFAREVFPLTGQHRDFDSYSVHVSILRNELFRNIKRKSINGFDFEKLGRDLFEKILLSECDYDHSATSIENFTAFCKLAEKIKAETETLEIYE